MTVSDTVLPVAVCRNISIQLNSAGQVSIDSLAVNNASSDACGIASFVVSPNTFTCANIGANTVTMTVTDVNGNSSICTSTVTVSDTVVPVAICKNITGRLNITGNLTIDSLAVNNASSDACGIASFAVTPTAFTCANIGANTVTMTVIDVNGNSSTCTSTVTVVDTVAPTAVCRNISVQLDSTGSFTIDSLALNSGSSDACGIASFAVSPNTFTCANVGANTVTMTVTDVNGNSSTCTSTVTISNQAPVLSNPGNQQLSTAAGSCSQLYTISDPIWANCTATWGYTLSGVTTDTVSGIADGVNSAPITFNKGVTIVTLSATDVTGGAPLSYSTFTVTVLDQEAPVITCPTTIYSCVEVVTYALPVSDNCGSVTMSYNPPSGSSFAIGSTSVVAIATDQSGNADTCSFQVVRHNTTSDTTVTSFGCYTWYTNNKTYTVSGTYPDTVTGVSGCDSFLFLHLTITPGVYLRSKAILSGPYISAVGLMHDSLRVNNLIPLTEPYTAQPFNKMAIGGAAGETVSSAVLSITGNNAIVDWIFVELRSATSPSTVLVNKRALIQRDGDIVSTDGISPLHFPTLYNGKYYVSIKHRNHLGIMSSTPVLLSGCFTNLLDFTSSSVYIMPSAAAAPRRLFGSVYALWAGDANNNKNVKYNGLSNDKDAMLQSIGSATPNNLLSGVYRTEDNNMDGKIRYNNFENDRMVILDNIGVSTPNNLLSQHVPN